MDNINDVPKLFSNIPSVHELTTETAQAHGLDIAKEALEADESSIKTCAAQSAGCFMATLSYSEASIFQNTLFKYTEISESEIDISEINAVSIFIVQENSKSHDCDRNFREALAMLAVSTAIGLDIVKDLKGIANPRGRVPIGFFLHHYWIFRSLRNRILKSEIYSEDESYISTHEEFLYQKIETRRTEMLKEFDNYPNYSISLHDNTGECEDTATKHEDIASSNRDRFSVVSDSVDIKDYSNLEKLSELDECSKWSNVSSTQETPNVGPAMRISEIFDRWVNNFADKHKSARSCNRRAAALMIDTLHLSDSIPLEHAILPPGWSDSLSKAIYESVNTPRTRRDRVEATKNFIKFMSPVGALKELETWTYSGGF